MAREWWSAGFFDMEMAQVLFNPERMKQARKEVGKMIKLAKMKKGQRVLDAACGVGRHSLEFARKGFHATGVDISEEYILEARKRLRKERLSLENAEFQQGELRDLYRFHGTFDLVVNLFTSFGYYEQAKDNQEALRQMVRSLKKGGYLIMELMPRETLDEYFAERDWHEVEGGYLLYKRQWTAGGRRLRADNIWIQGNRHREFVSEIFVYTRDELKAMFRRAGLSAVKAYGDFSGNPYQAGDRLVMVGRR